MPELHNRKVDCGFLIFNVLSKYMRLQPRPKKMLICIENGHQPEATLVCMCRKSLGSESKPLLFCFSSFISSYIAFWLMTLFLCSAVKAPTGSVVRNHFLSFCHCNESYMKVSGSIKKRILCDLISTTRYKD
ncbi:CLUMA_CG013475, isoform A [Clunio marinus]|uniref:CLUMA_CG013475, isoform A n=1 Tax=Clunio marinus TaxID=568069 RepID=A0A1J1INZ1_9DIPT|nr:CLUMA_CG013475, isoform A [Clunio marinus]